MAEEEQDSLSSMLGNLDGAPPPAPAAPAAATDTDDNPLAGIDLKTPAEEAPKGAGKKPMHAAGSNLSYAEKVALSESGGDPNAKARGTSATGLGQFTNDTWLSTVRKHRPDLAKRSNSDLLAMRSNPDLSNEMIEAHGNDNAEKLKAAGIPVNDATKYGAHWFGSDGFSKIYHAAPHTPIEDLIGDDAAANNGLAGKNADQVRTLIANKMFMGDMPTDMSWGDTLSLAKENLWPSVRKAGAGIYETVRHPLDTLSTLKQVGKGLESKIEGWAGTEQDPEQKANDEALVDAMANSYKQKYGSLEGFKSYLAHDPASVAFDASTVLTGGGGIAAKAPGLIGKAGEVAAGVGRAVNPLNPLGVVSKTIKAVTSPAAVLTAAGDVAPKVDALIKKVTDGAMSGADLVDPEVKTAFAKAVSAKGISEASVREGLLRSLGLKAPTSVTTGAAPPASAAGVVKNAIDANNEALAARAAKLASASASPSDLGAALDKAHTDSLNAANAAYDKIRTLPGSFGKTVPNMKQFDNLVRNNFSKSGIPAADVKTLAATGHPQAATAVNMFNRSWGSGKTLMGPAGSGTFDSKEIFAMRKALSNLRNSASGSDITAMGDIINAFDQHMHDLANKGLFRDPAGKPVTGLGALIKNANASYRKHFSTFETPNGANNAVVNAVKKLKTGQGRGPAGIMPSGDADLYTHAQGALAKDLLHPVKGGSTYNQLSQALGTSAPIDEYLKSMLLNPETKGATEMLNNPNSVAAKAFQGSPDDLSRAKHIQAANALNNTKPALDARTHAWLSDVAGRTVWKGISSLLGEHYAGPLGAVLGPTVVEPAAERISEARAATQAMAGAPHTQGKLRRFTGTAARALAAPRAIAAEHYTQQAQAPENQVIARASGGKVDVDSLVEKLMRRWKSAKKATDSTTKPLLAMPDATIVKALEIAKRSI